MSILKLRTHFVEKIKAFGNNFHPVLRHSIEENIYKRTGKSIGRILSIDDNKICQKINVSQLQKFGCSVECVHSARQALEKLTSAYEIIFLDVNLPDCSIEIFINLIRSDEQNSNQKTPIVLTCAWLNEAYKKNYLALGVNEIHIKPMKENDFEKILKRYSEVIN